jgi:enoyl-CoA hydratase
MPVAENSGESMPTVRSEIINHVAVVTLADPSRRNAISLAMVDEISDTFDRLEADPEVGAVVMTGEGRAFCAGARLEVLGDGDAATFRRIYDAFLRVARCPLPTIAAINGAATGAGLNMALCCDVRVVSESARLIGRFLDLGLHPGGGATWMLPQTIGFGRAYAMLLLGEELDADGAVRSGFALRSVPDDRLLDDAVALAGKAAALPRALVIRTKQTLRTMPGVDDLETAVGIEAEAQAWSAEQPFFEERLTALRERIASSNAS